MKLTDIHRESLSSQRIKIHILFKCTWIIFKDRPHDSTQNKPQQIQDNWNHIKYFLGPQGLETGNPLQRKKTETFIYMGT